MQIASVPPPLMTNALPQDMAAKAVPNLQAMAPLVQNAVDPSPKSEKNSHSRSNHDRGKGGGRGEGGDAKNGKTDKRGGSVNIRV
ncbi:MAG: hypothetical protein P4M15_14995 [Alphaproteobacteria bacterium]|nr:hypothetical protein [Alphaproteobacteria bacterium]